MKKILIAEDDKLLGKGLKDKLTRKGFDIIRAKDGKEGLDLSLKEKPDLILLDIAMPKMSGMEMLRELRKDDWGKDVKIIILTNLADENKAREAAEYNVFDYLVKSNWSIKDISQMIIDILK